MFIHVTKSYAKGKCSVIPKMDDGILLIEPDLELYEDYIDFTGDDSRHLFIGEVEGTPDFPSKEYNYSLNDHKSKELDKEYYRCSE